MRNSHAVHLSLAGHNVLIHLIGCGGNGCHVLMGLCQLQKALVGLGHPGITVTAFDPDQVSAANLGRQLFTEAEIGQNKAITLVHRANVAFGLNWHAFPLHYHARKEPPHIVISCVDSKQARSSIHGTLRAMPRHYWLDLGNSTDYGQVLLGEAGKGVRTLPNIADLHPEMLEGYENEGPSCSLAEALERQDLFINRALTAHALHILWTLFRKTHITVAGCFLNLREMTTVPIPVQPVKRNRKTTSTPGKVL